MKRKQLTAMFLSAAMVLTNSGIAFAAQNVGEPDKNLAKGENVWITLDANGGEFQLDESEEDPGTASTASRASRSVSTSTTLKVGGPAVEREGNDPYFLFFGDAKPVVNSAEPNWDVVTQGPETPKEGAQFAGWYVDLNDLNTKLTADSKLYGDGEAAARWVSTNQATVDDTVKDMVQEVEISGLEGEQKLTFAALDDTKTKDAQELTEIVSKADLSNLGFSSVELSKNDDALVQLEISVSGSVPGEPVGITMKDPFDGKYEDVLVIHLTADATKAQDVQNAVMDKGLKTLSFTAKGFSPYILAAVDTKMAKVKVENVKNGALTVYSETPVDGGVKRTYVPIGEEVEIPVGTELLVDNRATDTDGINRDLKNFKYQVTSGGKTEDIRSYESYTVTGDAVISAEFVETGRNYVTPARIYDPAVYEGTVICYTIGDDGNKVNHTVSLSTDPHDAEGSDNALFTLENGILKSKDVLPYGSYKLRLEYKPPETGRQAWTDTITVGSISINPEPDSLPKEGILEGTVKVFLKENRNWVVKNDWSVELDSERNSDGENDLFTLNDNILKSKDILSLGKYYPSVKIQIPNGRSYQSGISVSVGVESDFFVSLAEYERTSGTYTYTDHMSYYLNEVHREEGSSFADAQPLVFTGYVKEIAMYGNHPFKGWADEDGNEAKADQVLESYNSFYAVFDGYTPVKVETTDSGSDDPDDPNDPDNPDNPNNPNNPNTPGSGDDDNSGGTSGGGSSSGGRGSSSSSSSAASTISGNWQRDEKGWWFRLSGGGYATNQWGKVNNVWYYFNNEGYMATGWQFINDQWYYLTETEAGQGAMVTGWHFDANYQRWFYLGSNGDMLTGWQQINGVWYYLNPISDGTKGAMAANTTIDGYYVNADGAWVE